jgi:hypothetical protein
VSENIIKEEKFEDYWNPISSSMPGSLNIPTELLHREDLLKNPNVIQRFIFKWI